ncbi:MSMEG_1061 family FMN-dependent PPOX-type flavoprotein [Azospirillum sp. B506]|uniref:MSMEG_1061 family FMN-dependent PPOX-type flavoprotein n=1 Tax=Azospirillum sp. B506 TaxID=137721 RepID=UPI00034D8C00|nr:MSMEG_1061 family FMN-dependent PPOX-type flavoprotein [Azospirillum sp. B506]
MDPHRIHTVEALRRLYDMPTERMVKMTFPFLDDHCLRFVAESPLVFVATMADSGMDCSPRGGRPGFVLAEDRRTLALPDWPGNNKLSSITNILTSDGACGLVFLVPGTDVFLRVNGVATVTTDPVLLDRLREDGRMPKAAIRLSVREAFFHCGKALRRSHLWQPDAWVVPQDMPSPGQVVKDQSGLAELSVEQIDAMYEKALAEQLYSESEH